MENLTNYVDRICQHCKWHFKAKPHQVSIGKALYCNRACSAQARKPIHGHAINGVQSRTYVTYQNMIGRCHRKGHAKYYMYGAKGISVCSRWRESFKNFLCDMGERPAKKTINRIDGTLGYSKENCQWSDAKTQQANIRTNVNITFKGITKNVSSWAEELGLEKTILAWRIRNGWTVEEAFTTKVKYGNRVKRTHNSSP